MILDIHTHKPYPQPIGLINLRFQPTDTCSSELLEIKQNQFYTIGLHPWDLNLEYPDDAWAELEKLANLQNVIAIGECGIDTKIPAPLYKQLTIFNRHIALSENIKKPLIIHAVKADDIICGLRRDLKPTQPWAIHGYRGKPGGAAQLIKSGCYLSFGKEFNPQTLKQIPKERILAETDDSETDIRSVINRLSEIRNEDLTYVIESNSEIFCNFGG